MLSETFWIAFITSITATIVLAIKMCFKSKCYKIDCFLCTIYRDTDHETNDEQTKL